MMTRLVRRAGWTIVMVLSVGVALFSYRYLTWSGPLAPNVVANPYARPWLPIHAGAAAAALLVGAFQLLPRLRARVPGVHRWAGRLYVLGCLVGGVSGFVLALGSTAGPIATAGFGTLALFWFYATVRAWQFAMAGRFAEHRAWMIRSWALTLAAVSLRLYLPLAQAMAFDLAASYRAISWLCWTGNLALAELWLAGALRRTPRAGSVDSPVAPTPLAT